MRLGFARLLLPFMLLGCGGDAPTPAGQAPDTTGIAADAAAPENDAAVVENEPAGDAPAVTASDVVRRYYDAIGAGRYRDAWLLWSGGGAASGQSFDEFTDGFAETAEVEVGIGEPGRIEGAAGSRYVEVPVVVRAVTTDGTRQRFTGSYTLRRSVVDGATAEQRAWRIHSADIREVE